MAGTKGRDADPAPGRLAERKQRTRAAILDAAARLFSTQGYNATTMQDIATLAEVGLGTVYGYFPSKEDVLRTALKVRRDEAVGRGAAELRRVRGAVDRACLLLRQVWEYLDANRQMSLALTAIDTAIPGRSDSSQVDLHHSLVRLLERGQLTGEVAPIPLETAVRALLSTYTWAALHLGVWRTAPDPAAVLADLDALTRRWLTPGA